MTKTALGNEDGDFLTGSSWFERDYYFFKKSDLLINDSNRIGEKELLEQRKKFFSVQITASFIAFFTLRGL